MGPSRIASMLLLALVLAACDVEGWLRARDVRTFREVEVAEAERLLAEAQGVLVEAVESEQASRRIRTARAVAPDATLPAELVADPAPLVVVGNDDTTARRLAARLVRAGATKVAVVRGGVAAWRDREQPRTAGSKAVF